MSTAGAWWRYHDGAKQAGPPLASSYSKCSRKIGREMPKTPAMTSSEVPQDTRVTTSSRCLFVGLNGGRPPYLSVRQSFVEKPSTIFVDRWALSKNLTTRRIGREDTGRAVEAAPLLRTLARCLLVTPVRKPNLRIRRGILQNKKNLRMRGGRSFGQRFPGSTLPPGFGSARIRGDGWVQLKSILSANPLTQARRSEPHVVR
jgi:hypothetical protein